MSGEKFPGLDEIKRRAAVPKDQRKPRGRPRTRPEPTPEELAKMSPSVRRRATKGFTIPVFTGEGIKRAGVPTRLTPALLEDIVKKLTTGASVARCAGSCGVSPNALAEWLSKGADPDYKGTIFEELVESVARSRDEFAVSSHAVIASGRPGWKGRAWLAERLMPELAPPKKQLEHSGTGAGGAIRITGSVELPAEIPDGHPSLKASGAPSSGGGKVANGVASPTPRGVAESSSNGHAVPILAEGVSLPPEDDPD
mgnify:FL=1